MSRAGDHDVPPPLARSTTLSAVKPHPAAVCVYGDMVPAAVEALGPLKGLDAGGINVAAVATNPKRPGEVYAATTDGRLFVSRDGGQAWDAVR